MAKELYVGHLSPETTEADLRRLFSVMGTVTSVHLITDTETREFKRCGYVRMAADVDPKEVAETLDGAYLIDREIVVSIARPQKQIGGKPAGRFGAPKKAGFGTKGGGGQKAGAAPRGSSGTKAVVSKPGKAQQPGDGSKPMAGARPAIGAKSGDGHRSGGEKKGPRRGR
ncbi:MAG TPA: RNA-binding protein [Desulfuromonadaceae bacterium]